MHPKFFSSPPAFRKWLEKNHQKETELLVGFYKTGSGKPGISWPQSVDEALCFGWIDGVRKSLGKESYTIRFTPRKADSNWSAVNIRKVSELTRLGLMRAAGLAVFGMRDRKKSKVYSFEKKSVEIRGTYLKIFKSNKRAWDFFTRQAPSYQKACRHWIMSAKQDMTRKKRLEKIISYSHKQLRVK